MKAEQKGSLREVMPQTAAIVDDLRVMLGKEWADRIVLGGKLGRRTFYCAEIGADGVLREFGTSPSGRRGVVVDGRVELVRGT